MNLDNVAYTQYQKRIASAMDYIQANLKNNPDLKSVARKAHLSPFHFHRIFKLVVGETVADFTRRIRLEKAAGVFFYHKDISVTEVALELGFSSSQNMAKSFKQHFNLTPSDIRQLTSREELHHLLSNNSKSGNMRRKNGNAKTSELAYAQSPVSTSEDGTLSMDIKIVDFEERQVIYKRLTGVSGQGIQEAFSELHQFAKRHDLPIADPIYLIWDNPEITPMDRCRADACITLTSEVSNVAPFNTQTIAAGKYAQIRTIVKNEHEFDMTWESLFQQILTSGYQPEDKPCFKILHNESSDPLKGIFDVSFCACVK